MGVASTAARRRFAVVAYLVGGLVLGAVFGVRAVAVGPHLVALGVGYGLCALGLMLLGTSLSLRAAARSPERRGDHNPPDEAPTDEARPDESNHDVGSRRQALDRLLGRRPSRAGDAASMRVEAETLLRQDRGQLVGILGESVFLAGVVISSWSGPPVVIVTVVVLAVVSWVAYLWHRTRSRRAEHFLRDPRAGGGRALGRAWGQGWGRSYGGGMVTSVAVLSDVHGVLPVLEAVLAEPDVAAADLVVVCGDHAAGPMPVEVLDRLVSLGSRAVLVRGNADRELVEISRGGTSEHAESVWAAGCLRPDQVELLAGLPHPVVLEVDGFGPVLFCHGTPRDDEEVVVVDTRLEKWAEVFAGLPPEVRTVVCGHTHMPFIRLVDRRLVVNPGSVGMPYGRPGGSWVLLNGGQVELRHTEVDPEATLAVVVACSTYPQRQTWAEEYLRATTSDADALRAFGPRDGR